MTIPPLTMTCDEDGCAASIHADEGYPALDEALLTGLARLRGWRTTNAGARPFRHFCPIHNPEGRMTFDVGEQESQKTAIEEVLGFLGEEGGKSPGSFTRALIEAMFRADSTNLGQLAGGFPFHSNAVFAYKTKGPAELRAALGDVEGS